MNAPHRKTPPTAQLTLEIDGVPYTAQVTLTVGQPVQAKRSTALTVVQPQPVREGPLCGWCAFAEGPADACAPHSIAQPPDCTHYSPSLRTRLLRAFRLGRAPVYLASPKPAEQDSSDASEPAEDVSHATLTSETTRAALRSTLRTNPLD